MTPQLARGFDVSSIAEVSINSTVNSVRADDWTPELAIIVSRSDCSFMKLIFAVSVDDLIVESSINQ